MSNKEFDRDKLCEAVGEDNELASLEKGMVIRWSKAGESPPSWIPYEDPVVWVYTEIRGPCRRLLQRDNFWPTELRDENGREVAPSEFSGERITGVGGYIPRASVKLQSTIRSDSTHASVVSNDQSGSDSSGSTTLNRSSTSTSTSSGGAKEQVTMDNTDETAGPGDTSDEESDYKITDPLDW